MLCRIFGITVGEYHMGGKGPHIPKTTDIDQKAVKHAIVVLQPNVFATILNADWMLLYLSLNQTCCSQVRGILTAEISFHGGT